MERLTKDDLCLQIKMFLMLFLCDLKLEKILKTSQEVFSHTPINSGKESTKLTDTLDAAGSVIEAHLNHDHSETNK